jgi:hypothetical protein
MRENHPSEQQFIKEENKRNRTGPSLLENNRNKIQKMQFHFQVETCQLVETN